MRVSLELSPCGKASSSRTLMRPILIADGWDSYERGIGDREMVY